MSFSRGESDTEVSSGHLGGGAGTSETFENVALGGFEARSAGLGGTRRDTRPKKSEWRGGRRRSGGRLDQGKISRSE